MESAREMLRSDAGPIWHSVGVWMMAISRAATGQVAEAVEELDEDLQLSAREGREVEIQWMRRFTAGITWLALGRDAAREPMSDFIRSGQFESVSVGERNWREVTELLAGIGLVDDARTVLAMWERDMGSLAGSGLREARRIVDAAALAEPAARAEALMGLREEMNCPSCFEWWLAELWEEAGDLDAAAAHYQAAMSVAHGERNLFPVMRVVGHERLGRILAAQGDAAAAAEHYRAFATAWFDADAALQPRVRAAREAAAGG